MLNYNMFRSKLYWDFSWMSWHDPNLIIMFFIKFRALFIFLFAILGNKNSSMKTGEYITSILNHSVGFFQKFFQTVFHVIFNTCCTGLLHLNTCLLWHKSLYTQRTYISLIRNSSLFPNTSRFFSGRLFQERIPGKFDFTIKNLSTPSLTEWLTG